MGYSSKGRKPIERASKIAHGEIINNPNVVAFLKACTSNSRRGIKPRKHRATVHDKKFKLLK